MSLESELSVDHDLNRRQFLTLSLSAAGALMLPLRVFAQTGEAPAVILKGFLEISPANRLTLNLNRHEMGQGLMEGLATLLGEELGTDPALFQLHWLATGPDYAARQLPSQGTGGSFSMRGSWEPVRLAGAYCRAVLLQAAQLTLPGHSTALTLRDGAVVSVDAGVGTGAVNSVQLTFADALPKVAQAAAMVNPETVQVARPPWRFIGQPGRRIALLEKVTGRMVFGIDRAMPRVAMVARPARFGAELDGYDRAAAMAVKGVESLLVLRSGVAVVASNTWAARQGQQALKTRWKGGSRLSSEDVLASLGRLLPQSDLAQVVEKEGQPGVPSLERVYQLPMLAQCPLEPLSCTVSVSATRCELWVGTQTPDAILALASRMTGLSPEQIQLHDEPSGGSFGRRLALDFIIEALELGIQLKQPVKVVWSREDFFAGGYFRPPAVIRLQGIADADGHLAGLHHRIVSPGKLWDELPGELSFHWKDQLKHYVHLAREALTGADEWEPGMRPSAVIGDSAVNGMRHLQYAIPARLVEHIPVQLDIPCGFWRSVGHSLNLFALEAFLDEWAVAQQQDPLQLRLQLLAKGDRLRTVLQRVCERAQWQQRSVSRPLGLACFFGYGTRVALVVQLQQGATRPDHIEQIYCAVDCGVAINPDVVRAQIEGAITMGLSSALYEQIQLEDGNVTSLNFDHYPLLRMADMPPLQIDILHSDAAPGGIGEAALPVVAPALVNAWRLLSGQNIASLPLMPQLKRPA